MYLNFKMSNNINEKQLKGRFYCTVRSLDTNIHKTYQQKYEFLKNEFINNEKFSENESQYLLNMLLKDYFYESTQSKSTKNCGSNQERYASLKKEFANYKKFTENERQCILNMLLRDYYFDTAWSMKSSVYRTYQQKYEFFKTQFDNNENLEIHEKQYLFNMLQKRFDNLSVINNDGEKRHCENCKSATYALQYCEFCVRDYLQKSYRKWTGNDEIDNAIKKAQERAMGPNLIIEFIPNEKLKINPNHIAEGGYAKIYKAVWIDGPFDVWNKEEKVLERTKDYNVILKKLKGSNKSTGNWINEVDIAFTNHEECPENFTGAGMQFPDDISSGEGPGAFLRSRIQFSDVISSGEGPGPFLNSRIYSFLNLAEPSNFAKVVLDKIRECDFDNVIELFDTDSSDFGFEKVDNTVESLESLRYHDNTDEEYVTISKKSQQKDSSQESVNENYNNDEMTSIVDLLFLIFSKLHNEGFNEVKINKKINKYIAINGKTPNSVFIWLCNNKAMSKQTCLLGRFYHGGIGTDMNKERAFYTFLNVEENAGKNEAGRYR
ncbi:protein kinase [Gigaspora margarita]|uniref:Protein kinase n=1 Tax=Gigaspora margarita TaxID=4874 RepID=A0A8H4ESD2_GIGMA|nr:protein kinase [Gigaspora margarita]